jgi:hypothetical protein
MTHFNELFYNALSFFLVPALQKMQNETIIKMRSVTARRFKKISNRQKRWPHLLKD